MLTTFKGDTEITRSLEAGASGFLLKSSSPTELVATIRRVHAGKKSVAPEVAAHLAEYLTENTLTSREIEIVRLIAAGNRNRDVAVALSIAEATVKAHVQHIIEKLGARDRTEAVVLAIRRGIIEI
jgi:DNA-binding NarL/FixJ family response regulator